MQSIIIGIAGGTASGKSTLAKRLQEHYEGVFGKDSCVVVSSDGYYKTQFSHLSPAERAKIDFSKINFDDPETIDFEQLETHIKSLKLGNTVNTPQYDFTTHARIEETKSVEPVRIIIVEGILVLHTPELAALFDETIFVDATDDLRYNRRKVRDMKVRHRTAEEVKAQYDNSVRPMYDRYVAPSKAYARIVVTNQGNEIGFDIGPVVAALKQVIPESDAQALEFQTSLISRKQLYLTLLPPPVTKQKDAVLEERKGMQATGIFKTCALV